MAKKPLAANDPKDKVLDEGLLTAEEIADLSAEVQEEVDSERKDAAKKALRTKLQKEAREREGLLEAQDQVTVDLAPYCDRILIDNRAYLQGQTYTVPVGRAQTIREMCQRTWNHQSEIDGKSENFYRRTRGARVIPAGNGAAVINASQLLKA